VIDVISARNILVLELGENQHRFTDIGDLVRAGGDVLEGLGVPVRTNPGTPVSRSVC
jgi:hypothetical protein